MQSNEVQQIVPLQSYFTIELEIDDTNFPTVGGNAQTYNNTEAVAPTETFDSAANHPL